MQHLMMFSWLDFDFKQGESHIYVVYNGRFEAEHNDLFVSSAPVCLCLAVFKQTQVETDFNKTY